MTFNFPPNRPIPPERVQTLVKQIADKVWQDFGTDVQVIWFGSWVKGNARPNSDIDLAIASLQPIQPRDFAMLRDWVENLPTLYSFDLINLNEASPSLASEIKENGIKIKPIATTR